MSIEVKVPQLPESVTDATLVAWHKAPGDAVNRDESLVDLETDKVVLEVPAPVSGVIKEIRVQNGATVRSGDLLAVLEAGEARRRAGSGAEGCGHAGTGGRCARAGQPARRVRRCGASRQRAAWTHPGSAAAALPAAC